MTTDQKLNQAAFEMLALAQKWENEGVIVAIERLPSMPLAMGNHVPLVHAWPKRERSASSASTLPVQQRAEVL